MKVLHILHELKYSGAEIMYVDAAPIFQELGCELYVVNTTKRLGEYAKQFQSAGYHVLHKPVPSSPFKKISYYYKMIYFLKSENIDIVHIHDSSLRLSMAICAYCASKKSVYTFHNAFKSRYISYLYHCFTRWVIKTILKCKFQTISDSVYNNELSYYHNKTIKIYNWYGNTRFYPAKTEKEKKDIRKELGISESTLVIISVGGCSTIKRHTEILKALKRILKRIPNCLYLHLGTGEALSHEIDFVKQNNLDKNVLFLGNQENVRKYLIASDIYLMTSKFEGIPITTIEALACKIPSILYNVPGLRDFNNESENVILIKESSKILANEIIALYQDKERMIDLSNNGKKYVDTKFDIYTNVNKIFNLYK